MKKLLILLCLLPLFISINVEAKVEKIGTNDIVITLSEDFGPKKSVSIPLLLKNSSDKDKLVYFELTGFKSKDNAAIIATLKIDGEPSLKYEGIPTITEKPTTFLAANTKVVTLECIFSQVSDEYTGTLNIHSFTTTGTTPAVSESDEVKFTFKKYAVQIKELPESAFEVGDSNQEPIYISKLVDLVGSEHKETGHEITLTNKTSTSSINNIKIQPVSFVKVEKDKKLSVKFDAQEYSRQIDSLKSNEFEVVSLPIPIIETPGTYKIKYNIGADETKPQQIEATVYARYGLTVAVIILFLGSLLSYFVTRVVVILKTKHDRSTKINEIKRKVENYDDDNEYLKERIRALADISETLNSSNIFIAPEKTKYFLDVADCLLKVGMRKGQIWHYLQRIGAPEGLIELASKHLKEVDWRVAKYDVISKKADIDSELDKAQDFANVDQQNIYWPILKERIEKFFTRVAQQGGVSHKDLGPHWDSMKDKLENDKNRTDIDYEDLRPIEQDLIKLDVMHKQKDKLKNLNPDEIAEIMMVGDEENFYRTRFILLWKDENDKNWDRIEQNKTKNLVKINEPSYLDQKEVGVFTVDFGNDDLNRSYLVRKELEYEWHFNAAAAGNNTELPPIILKTNSLAKYFSELGTYNITLTIRNKANSRSIEITKNGIEVAKNKDLKIARQISKIELVLALFALVLAVLSGMQTEYFTKADFGSTKDIIALFIWAAAFDQGKNIVGWAKGISTAQKPS